MPTNAFTAIVMAATWLTNHPPVADGPRGAVWHQTNVVSFQTVVAVVGPGIPALQYTNTVAISTNVRRFEIVETALVAPVVSMVVTAKWPPAVSGLTNGVSIAPGK